MKLIKITYTRKYNLGNYETHDITLEAEMQDDDNPQTVLTSLANVASDWHLSQKREATQAQPVKTPAQLANEEYTRTHPQTVTWQPRPATSLGPYEATTNLTDPNVQALVQKCEEEQHAIDKDGYRYWVMKKNGVVEALARRPK